VRGQTRDKIKAAALSLFANNGYDATSMEQIATGVGIRKSSLYAFINSKEELFWEIYSDLETNYRQYMEQFLTDSANMPAPERLYFLFRHYLEGTTSCVAAENLQSKAFLHRAQYFPPAAFKEKLLARILNNEMRLGEKYQEIISEGISRGLIREELPEAILLAYYSVRHGLAALMSVFMAEITEEEKLARIDKVWQIFWQGIKAK
jgi:AcrR family transcriptional regulator